MLKVRLKARVIERRASPLARRPLKRIKHRSEYLDTHLLFSQGRKRVLRRPYRGGKQVYGPLDGKRIS